MIFSIIDQWSLQRINGNSLVYNSDEVLSSCHPLLDWVLPVMPILHGSEWMPVGLRRNLANRQYPVFNEVLGSLGFEVFLPRGLYCWFNP